MEFGTERERGEGRDGMDEGRVEACNGTETDDVGAFPDPSHE